NASVYGRGERMYSALRDVIGDDAFRRFLATYYDRWAFRHVDEAAMRRAAEDASGRDLGWFFDQWLRRTGLVDYAVDDVRTRREGADWVTTARVTRRGEYFHPVALGVRTDSGWVTGRGEPTVTTQVVTVRTTRAPREVRLDPIGASSDWYGPNDVADGWGRLNPRTARVGFDWPFLQQTAERRFFTGFSPLAWYSRPGGLVLAARLRSNYAGTVNRLDLGLAGALKVPEQQAVAPGFDAADPSRPISRFQGWISVENPRFPMATRPAMGFSMGLWWLDGIALVGAARTWDQSQFLAGGTRVSTTFGFTGTYPYDRNWPDARRWSLRSASDLTLAHERRAPEARGTTLRVALTGGVATGRWGSEDDATPYARGEASYAWLRRGAGSRWAHFARVYGGFAVKAPVERGVYLSAQSPTQTFGNHLWRPDDGVLALPEVPFTPLGGAGLRGYDPVVGAEGIVALNLEEARRLHRFGRDPRGVALYAGAFADVGAYLGDEQPLLPDRVLADAGVGLAVRGQLFDRDVRLRADVPLWVSTPDAAIGLRDRDADDRPDPVRLRFTFSFTDLW
ncbi:MAG TPA: M1 family aminopeptidase, partial [Gemmatimonadaceae bacterium]|nr:M1 family aminopeptidase [Gemmatimonadaceae bacterium]